MSGRPDPRPSASSRSGSGPAPNAAGTAEGVQPTDPDASAADRDVSGGGVRARIVAHEPPDCPVVDVLPDGAVATDVRVISLDGVTIERFRVDHRIPDRDSIPVTPVFEADGHRVYRRRVEPRAACPYHTVESLGYPVMGATARTNPDRFRFTLHLSSVEPLGDVVDAVESTGASVTLERLTRSGADCRTDPVVVDRERLTDRQREVLATAKRLGYFSYPREASAEEVAAAVGIARSTFAEHLAAAQKRVIGGVIDGKGLQGRDA